MSGDSRSINHNDDDQADDDDHHDQDQENDVCSICFVPHMRKTGLGTNAVHLELNRVHL